MDGTVASLGSSFWQLLQHRVLTNVAVAWALTLDIALLLASLLAAIAVRRATAATKRHMQAADDYMRHLAAQGHTSRAVGRHGDSVLHRQSLCRLYCTWQPRRIVYRLSRLPRSLVATLLVYALWITLGPLLVGPFVPGDRWGMAFLWGTFADLVSWGGLCSTVTAVTLTNSDCSPRVATCSTSAM